MVAQAALQFLAERAPPAIPPAARPGDGGVEVIDVEVGSRRCPARLDALPTAFQQRRQPADA
jgi:hypothetical protein